MQLAYLPERKRDNITDDDVGSVDSDFSADRRSEVTNLDELVKDYRRNKRQGMLGWFKLKVTSFAFTLIFPMSVVLHWSIFIFQFRHANELSFLISRNYRFSNERLVEKCQFKVNIFLVQKPEHGGDSESSATGSPASSTKSSQNRITFSDSKDGQRKSVSRRGDDRSVVDSLPERTQAGDLFSATVGGRRLPSVRETTCWKSQFYVLLVIVHVL